MTVEQKCAGVSKFTEDGKDLGLSLWAGGLDVLLILASTNFEIELILKLHWRTRYLNNLSSTSCLDPFKIIFLQVCLPVFLIIFGIIRLQ